jgi:uncharacterized protein
VAKLPRLMQQGPPQYVDPKRLARNRDDISGTLDIADMQRLSELLESQSGSVRFELQFDNDVHNRIRIVGKYDTELSMQCHRCLRPVAVNIARAINVTLVTNEDEVAKLSRDVEPLVLADRELSLVVFFEDELLLALPLAPNHETEECHIQESQDRETNEDRQRPFAVLKDLKLKNSKD